MNCFNCNRQIRGKQNSCEKCGINLHVNCTNVSIDQEVTEAGSFNDINCLQQSIPFTQIEDIDFTDLFTPSTRQQMFEKDYDRLKNLVFDPFNHNNNNNLFAFPYT